MAKTVYDVLIDKIEADMASAQDFLNAGSAKDYANYREIVGLIRGLRSSITHIQDLSRKQLEGDDD
mgnify:CR=1|jgi:hypothetical protein|tara:strand:+ start:453 stop:650 length:198 start_codon:yes stop_codon:yes gene_type:complete